MNARNLRRRPTAAVVVQSLLWLWLIGLSVIVALGCLACATDRPGPAGFTHRPRKRRRLGLAETIDGYPAASSRRNGR